MSVTYGFYNSMNGDRVYNAEQFSELFDGVINDGVFQSIGDHFMVRASTGMKVVVKSGRAWFNGTWTLNDSDLELTVPDSDPNYKRIDAVVIEVNSDISVRENSIKIISGTASSDPAKPAMSDSNGIYQYPLAYITVGKGVTTIYQSKIENAVGTSACPFVTGILKTVDIDSLLAQWKASWNEQLAEQDAEFLSWFGSLEDTLDGDVAANLAMQIDDVNDRIDEMQSGTIVWMNPAITGANRVKNVSGGWYRRNQTFYIQLSCVLDKDLAGGSDYAILSIPRTEIPIWGTMSRMPLNILASSGVHVTAYLRNEVASVDYIVIRPSEKMTKGDTIYISGSFIGDISFMD